MFVSTSREGLAEDLWAYGEDELAVRALDLSDLEMGRIGVIAGRLLLDDAHATPSGASMLLAKACALAAVEVMEGGPRALKRKRRRSVPEAREKPTPPARMEDEKPREVFLTACAELARPLEPLGFRYAKSGPHASRRSGQFTFVVSFASSHRNVAGEYVDLTAFAGVRSRALRQWRIASRGTEEFASDFVAGGMLQNLGVEMPLSSWDLADQDSRADVLEEIAAAIDDVALPYFALFEDPDVLRDRLQLVPVASFPALNAIEWLLSQNDREAAITHAHLLLEDGRLRRRYERTRKEMESGKLETLPYVGEAEGLAYAAFTYGLEY
jgi:hypothetical protein